jgi:hypothetical protein
MVTMLPPTPTSARDKLPCVHALLQHFNNGGISRKGYDMLYRMIEMMSAIGWEVHLIYQSKMPTSQSLTKIHWYLRCILQGVGAFQKHIHRAASKAKDVTRTLPVLDDVAGKDIDNVLAQWRKALEYVCYGKCAPCLALTRRQDTT